VNRERKTFKKTTKSKKKGEGRNLGERVRRLMAKGERINAGGPGSTISSKRVFDQKKGPKGKARCRGENREGVFMDLDVRTV